MKKKTKVILARIILVLILLFAFWKIMGFKLFFINGSPPTDRISHGDQALFYKPFNFSPDYKDIIVFIRYDDYFTGVVAGKPGDTVTVENSKIIVNGTVLYDNIIVLNEDGFKNFKNSSYTCVYLSRKKVD